jgi:two-component system, OmpR family, sensor kinase
MKMTQHKESALGDEARRFSQFTSGLAHEVRSPLNGMLAVAEALFQDIGDDPKYQVYLKHIREQGQRLSALMQDVQDLGRPIKPADMRPFEVDAFVNAAVQTWKQSAPAAAERVRLSGVVGPGRRVTGDEVRLRQALGNVLTNASQHNPGPSPICVAISQPKPGNVRIDVIDQGSGIPAENLDRALEPFYSTRKQASGLGLSIAEHIVKLHGGTVVLRNNVPPPGLTVSICLPLLNELE